MSGTPLNIPIENVIAWTDGTIVINWLDGGPRRFKTYIGNRISFIISHIPPKNWNRVRGKQNPSDCASRGLYPNELSEHSLWWHGPIWLRQDSSKWPRLADMPNNEPAEDPKELCLHVQLEAKGLIVPVHCFSSFNMLICVMSWVMCFVSNLKNHDNQGPALKSPLTVQVLTKAENCWISLAQSECFNSELKHLHSKVLPTSSALLLLQPLLTRKEFLESVEENKNPSLF